MQIDRSGVGHPDAWARAALFLTALAAVAAVVLLVCHARQPNVQVWQARQEAGVSRITDYTSQEILSPSAPLGVKQVYRFSLGWDVDRDQHLALYTVHQYAQVWIGGQCVYRMGPSAEDPTEKTVGSNWIMVPLCREYAGKKVLVELTPVYESFRSWKVTFLVGSQLAIYKARLFQDMPQLVLSVMAVFVGLFFLAVAGFQTVTRKKRGGALVGLGLFALLMGVWRFTDTRFTPLLFPGRPVFLIDLSICALMLGILSLVYFLRSRHRAGRSWDLVCLVLAGACLGSELLQLLGVADLRETLPFFHLVLLLSVTVLALSMLGSSGRPRQDRARTLGHRLPLVFLVGAAADLAVYYLRGSSSGLIFSLSGLILWTILVGISFLLRYQQKENLLMEQKLQLAESRTRVLLSQLQPHFLSNVLNSIYYLCEKDTGLAQEAIEKFADYLRDHLEALERDTLIPFAEEHQHIQTYLALEQLRFPTLTVEEDIQTTGFSLPPLTVQPLVENAVKHGVTKQPGGGTVTITTRETDTAYLVTVRDTGVGFDPARYGEDGKLHLGLRSVRERLESMAGGTLSIRSRPGEGTTAEITIPKQKGEEP